jgi:hypothetical protein
MTTEEVSGKITPISTSSTMWQRAIARYIDDDKPDAIRRRQIESWTFAWQPADDHDDMMAEEEEDDDDDAPDAKVMTTGGAGTKSASSGDQQPPAGSSSRKRRRRKQKRIAGTLTWTGEYVRLQLHCTSAWQEEEEQDGNGGSDRKNNKKNAAGTRFVSKCRVTQAMLRDDLVDAQQLKRQMKLAQRWKQQQEKEVGATSSIFLLDCPDPVELFEVSIISGTSSGTEERGYWHEACCAAIQTILYTTAESSLEVFEFIVRYLPMVLPQTVHDGLEKSTTKLADRAVLRLLEDATYDACAAEDSDTAEESLADLGLQDVAEANNHHDNNNDDDDDGGGKKNHKKEAKRRKRG